MPQEPINSLHLHSALKENLLLQRAVKQHLQSLQRTLDTTSELHGNLQQSSSSSCHGQGTTRRDVRTGHVVRIHTDASRGVPRALCFAGHLDHTQQWPLFARASSVALHRVDASCGRMLGGEPHLWNTVEEQCKRLDGFALGYLFAEVPKNAPPLQVASAVVSAGPPNRDDILLQGANSYFPSPMAPHGRNIWHSTHDGVLLEVLLPLTTCRVGQTGASYDFVESCDTMTLEDWQVVAAEVSRHHFRHRLCTPLLLPSPQSKALVRYDFNTFALPVTASCCRHRWVRHLRPLIGQFEMSASMLGAPSTPDMLLNVMASLSEADTDEATLATWTSQLHDLIRDKFGYLVSRPVWVAAEHQLSIDADARRVPRELRQGGVPKREPGSHDRKMFTVESIDDKQCLKRVLERFTQQHASAFQLASLFQRSLNPYHLTSAATQALHSDALQCMLNRAQDIVRRDGDQRQGRCAQRLLELLSGGGLPQPTTMFSLDEDTRLLLCANDLAASQAACNYNLAGDDDSLRLASRMPSPTDIGVSFYFRTLAAAYVKTAQLRQQHQASSCPADVVGGIGWGATAFFCPGLTFRTAGSVAHRWPALEGSRAQARDHTAPTSAVPLGDRVVDLLRHRAAHPCSKRQCCHVGGARSQDYLVDDNAHLTPLLPLCTAMEASSIVLPASLEDTAGRISWSDPRTRFLAVFALCTTRRVMSPGGAHLGLKSRGDVSFVHRVVLESLVALECLRAVSQHNSFSTRLYRLADIGVDSTPHTDGVGRQCEGHSEILLDESCAGDEPRTTCTSPRVTPTAVASIEASESKKLPTGSTRRTWTDELDAFLLHVVDHAGVPWRIEELELDAAEDDIDGADPDPSARRALILQPTVGDKDAWWPHVAYLMAAAQPLLFPQGHPDEPFSSTRCYKRFMHLKLKSTSRR